MFFLLEKKESSLSFEPFFRDISFENLFFSTNMGTSTKQQRKRERVHAWKQANHDKVLAQKKRYCD